MFRVIANTGCRRLVHRLVTPQSRNLSIAPLRVVTKVRTFPRPVSKLAHRYQSGDSSSKDAGEAAASQRIRDMITNSKKRVFLFMKGVPESPQCGYSNAVVQILHAYDVDFDSCNVLEDPEIRQGVKAYSNWPTIPQLYVDKEFVGGCDILIQMHQNNELEKLFDSVKSDLKDTPKSSDSSKSGSDQLEKTTQPEEETQVEEKLVEEEEFSISRLTSGELVPEVPIKSLDLVKDIKQVEKKGSFTVDIFTGKYDDQYLIYPEALDNRKQNEELKKQATMVRQLYPQIWDDERQLQKFNFFNLFQLSVTEMMTIFEAIGASARNCSKISTSPALVDQPIPQQTQISKEIISLIIRNCLTYWPMAKSESEKVKSLLPRKHILFGGSSEDDAIYRPIGFCWTENAPQLGSLPPQEWFTIGQEGDAATNMYLVKGKKTRVLYEDSVENYLVYFRDKFLSDKYNEDKPEDEPNPASDPFVGCCIVPKSQLQLSQKYRDSAGCEYVDIDIDIMVARDHIVFPAKRLDPSGVNVKALGQLATCSVVMGILKDSLKMTYQYLLASKKGLLDCDIVERKLSVVTSNIFARINGILYSRNVRWSQRGFDAHMEATVLKIVTNEYAYSSLKELQDICSSDMFIISKLQDQINIFDAFLDGNVYNRLYLSTMGIIWYARSKNIHLNQMRLAPWYPGYFVKSLLRERAERGDLLTLNADIYGSLHPALETASTNLEYIIKRVKFATESILKKYGKDAVGAQTALYNLSQLSIDTFLLTAMLARASKSYCNGSRNCEIDINIACTFARNLAREVRLYMEAIDSMPINFVDFRAHTINELNMKAGGYYAESPLDPNI